MRIYRMHRPKHDVFDTTGAFLNEGRWHSIGTRLIYTAQFVSLTVLETLVNSEERKLKPRLITSINLPDSCRIEYAEWLDKPMSRQFGDDWIREGRSAVLAVPSVVVNKLELNFLLNPAHPGFAEITPEESLEFIFDSRFSPSDG